MTTQNTTDAVVTTVAAATGAAGLVPVGAAGAPGTTALTVGAGKMFSTIGAAVAASHDGDVILVDSGTYTNDFATITAKITIEGVGGMVNMVATVPPPNLKGILTVDNDVTIKNVSFSGCAIPDGDGGNGAGIRYEGGQMVLFNDSFSNNQNGILASPVLAQLTVNTISIDHCLFSGNGSGTGYTHNLYVGGVDSLTATNSIFEGAVVGHEFKSRALANDIESNIFRDGPTGTASYDIDLPNGGADLIRNNLIEKGPDAQNDAMVHFGGEGIPYAGSSLLITGNNFVNDKGPAAVAVLNQTAISATINANAFTALAPSQLVQGPATGTGNTDGAGHALADISLTGVLPGNTTVFTDNAPHTVVLNGTAAAVEGGGGLLTVNAIAGHVVVIGGAGGLNFSEGPVSGGNTITTKAGSVNTVRLVGQDLIDSEGTDTITGGVGNITGLVGGTTTVNEGTGSDSWSIKGNARFIGHGGDTVATLATGASLGVTGPLDYLHVQDNGGSLSVNVSQGDAPAAFSMTGGAADVVVYGGATSIKTAPGTVGVTLRLGAGRVQVTSQGADTIWAGSGAATVIVSGRASVHAGSGSLTLYGRGDALGATFYGNGGDYLLGGDTGNITYYGGALASTIEAQLSGNTLIGGAGRLTIHGGSRETMTGGSGGLIYTASAGGGANLITTAANATDTLTLTGAETIISRGRDAIFGGTGNQAMTIYGNAVVTGSTGSSTLDFFGHDTLLGRGQDNCTVHAGAQVAITAGSMTNVSETGAAVNFAAAGPYAASLAMSGGSATVCGGTTTGTSVVTGAAGGVHVSLAQGDAAVALNGADLLQGGMSGTGTIAINAANVNIIGGAGALVVHDRDMHAGDQVFIHGGSGSLTYDQGPGALIFLGGSGTSVIDGGWGTLFVAGGAGTVTVNGGQSTRFVAGSGQAQVTLSPGGGDVTFGSGTTSVGVAGYGHADTFRFNAGAGGGTDIITGFRAGVDHLVFTGVAPASVAVVGGATMLTLTDNTLVMLAGLTNGAPSFNFAVTR